MAWRGELSKSIREIRILFCQTSPGSATVRDYIRKNYKELKTLNPRLPILLRECSGINPRLWVRYPNDSLPPAFGVEESVVLDGLSEKDIDSKLEQLSKHQPKQQTST